MISFPLHRSRIFRLYHHENVQGGALYIRALLERYAGDLAKALAAYNAGPAAVDRYRGIPPYAETQNYVRRVITRFNHEKAKEGIGNRGYGTE